MPVTIVAVGRMGEPLAAAAREYQKRLFRYDKLTVIEVPDQREPANLSPALMEQVMQREGQQILRHIRPGDHVAALCIQGESPTSEAFAQRLRNLRDGGSPIVFVIGGSLGLAPEVLARADSKLSLSALTMPHQLARVVLLEQIYRAFKILSGERYHK
mgnify:FL=1